MENVAFLTGFKNRVIRLGLCSGWECGEWETFTIHPLACPKKIPGPGVLTEKRPGPRPGETLASVGQYSNHGQVSDPSNVE